MLDPIAKELYAEIYARPFLGISLPCSAWQVVTKIEAGESKQAIEHLYALNNSSVPEEPGLNSLFVRSGNYDVRLERHREFCSFLFVSRSTDTENTLNEKLPYTQEWLYQLPGKLLIRNSIKLIPNHYHELDKQRMQDYFDDQRVIGNYVFDRRATVWTSFRLHDQSARYIAFVGDLSGSQTAYLLQQLVELETYRIMALLGFPMAKDMVLELGVMNDTLADILRRLPDVNRIDEQGFLLEITGLSAKLEALQAESSYRFGATRAYYKLVNERLENLNEEKFGQLSTLSVFLRRRLAPAMRTCDAIHTELIQLSARVASAISLLQARVSMTLEEQNRELLASMDQRGYQQLRLQQTVEGLSVAAITYYIIGLLDKLYSLAGNLPWSLQAKSLTALSIVPVALVVWWSVRKARTKITEHDS